MEKTRKVNIEPLLFDSYLEMIENSVGSKVFRTSYFTVNGKKKDVLQNGNLSCAFFVSSVLKLFDLVETLHVTVPGTTSDMKKYGWKEIAKPKKGCVLVWEDRKGKTGLHPHIGFYVGKDEAVSNNSSVNGKIVRHHSTYGARNKKPVRKIEKIFWNPRLG